MIYIQGGISECSVTLPLRPEDPPISTGSLLVILAKPCPYRMIDISVSGTAKLGYLYRDGNVWSAEVTQGGTINVAIEEVESLEVGEWKSEYADDSAKS